MVVAGVNLLLPSALSGSGLLVSPASSVPQVLHGHTGSVSSIAISNDGRLIATGSLDRTVRLWDAQTGKAVRVLSGHQAEVYAVTFSPDSRVLASSAYDGRVMLWGVKDGKVLRAIEIKGWSVALAFSPDGHQLAIGNQQRNIIFYDARSGAVLRTLESRSGVNTVAFSPDGHYFAAASGAIALWDAQTHKAIKTFRGHRDYVRAIVFTQDGHLLASASADKTARLWNVDTGESVRTLETRTPMASSYAPQPIPRKMPVTSVAFSPDGKLLAMTTGRTIHLWDVATGAPVQTLEGHTKSVTGVVFMPDGSSLASSSLDGTIRLWSLKSR